MAKKPSPLRNRLARFQTDRRSGVVAAALLPTDENRSLPEVAWRVLSQNAELAVADAAELAERLTGHPAFGSADATGWVAGVLVGSLVWHDVDPLADPKARGIEQDVIAALGPDAVWFSNGEHPIVGLRARPGAPGAGPGGWRTIIDATFDRVVVARGNGLDLVLARAEED